MKQEAGTHANQMERLGAAQQRLVEQSSGEPVNFAKFVIEPFERGFGVTVGNSLRRLLLSGLRAARDRH